LRLGIVVDTKDITSAGIIKVMPVDSKGQLARTAIPVVYLSMNIGAGQGIFSMPGNGTVIMYEDASNALKHLNAFEQSTDIPYKWVYVGSLTSQMIQRRGQSSVSDDKNDADEGNDTQKDYLQRDPFKNSIILDSGVPEAGLVYADNFLPQQDVWKHKCGHKFIMSHKITGKGRHDNSLLLQAASGKKIHIDDGPAQMRMDRITITDEHKNRIVIRTGGDNPDSSTIHTIRNQDYTTEKGSQVMTVMPASKGPMRRDQLGTGDMKDFVAKGNYNLLVEKDILRVSLKGDIKEQADTGNIDYNATVGEIRIEAGTAITLTCGASVITMTPASIVIDSPSFTVNSPLTTFNSASMAFNGTATLTGVTGTLNTHMHVGNHGIPTPVI
tara:strand:- start:14780 stop:15931 length:1152 start_codon:yes stop_codon:yes gene_type:complete